MAIPTSANIELSDVIAEIGSGDSLADCFANANAAGFNPTYEGNKDSLSNFRGYTHVTATLTAFNMTGIGDVDASASCSFSGSFVSFLHDGSGAQPVFGDTIYLDSSTKFTGQNRYYKTQTGDTIKISNSGVVIDKQVCI